jgi:hypothetical protein
MDVATRPVYACVSVGGDRARCAVFRPVVPVLALGNVELPDVVRYEVGGFVDREYPSEGVGDWYLDRAPASLAMPWQQAEEARAAITLRSGRSTPR